MISLIFLAASIAATGIDPLDVMANIKADHRLCSDPDTENKTCSSLTTFVLQDDGTVTETTEILITQAAPISMQMTAPLQVDGRKTCGTVTEEALSKVTFRVAGRPASAEQSAAIGPRITEALTPMIGRMACDELQSLDGILMKQGSVEGVDVSLPPKPVAWVLESEGYSVEPQG